MLCPNLDYICVSSKSEPPYAILNKGLFSADGGIPILPDKLPCLIATGKYVHMPLLKTTPGHDPHTMYTLDAARILRSGPLLRECFFFSFWDGVPGGVHHENLHHFRPLANHRFVL